jgi:hypothetical protein
LHILQEHAAWANNQSTQTLILKEIQRLILDNIDDIERHSKADSKGGCNYVRLSGSQVVTAAFSTRPLDRSTFIQMAASTWNSVPMAHFALLIWVFPYSPTDQSAVLPIDII